MKHLRILILLIITGLLPQFLAAQNNRCSANFNFSVNGNDVKFKPDQANNNTAWFQWRFGDGNGSSAYDPTHAYKGPGTYDVCLIMKVALSQNQYCYDTVCKKVEIKGNSQDTCRIPDLIKIEKESCNRFAFYYGGDTSKFEWYWVMDNQKISQRSFKETFKDGVYKVCIVVKLRGTNCTETFCRTLQVKCDNSEPNDTCNLRGIDWKFNVNCRKLVAEFTNPNNLQIQWKWIAEGRATSDKNLQHEFGKNGTYTVCLVVKLPNSNCADTICKKIEIKCDDTKDTCNLRGIDWKYDVNCRNLKAWPAINNNLLQWHWWVEGRKVNDKILEQQFNKDGVYKVCLIVNVTGTDCIDTICKEITIKCNNNNNDTCNLRGIDWKFATNCRLLEAHVTNGHNNLKYSWLFDGKTVDGEQLRHQFARAGKYQVCLVVTDGTRNCTDTICKWIEVKDCDPCNFRPLWGLHWLPQRQALMFKNFNGNNFDVEWSINGNVVSKGNTFVFQPTQTGFYRICMTVYSKDRKCKRERCINLVVINRKSGNGLEIQLENADDTEEISGTLSDFVPKWTIMPNPVTDYLKVRGDVAAEGEYRILGANGQVVMEGTLREGESIRVSELAQGVYLLWLHAPGLSPGVAKFIK